MKNVVGTAVILDFFVMSLNHFRKVFRKETTLSAWTFSEYPLHFIVILVLSIKIIADESKF